MLKSKSCGLGEEEPPREGVPSAVRPTPPWRWLSVCFQLSQVVQIRDELRWAVCTEDYYFGQELNVEFPRVCNPKKVLKKDQEK